MSAASDENAGKPAGSDLHDFIAELYPICRSITGAGLRETLALIGRRIPLALTEVPTGTNVFDWTVPPEWNVNDAFVADSSGRRIIDFRANNLHLLNYSVPVHASMSLADLRPHLHSLPDQPHLIPYRTSYYTEAWGFCLPHEQLAAMTEDSYEVLIDSSLEPGSLTYGEWFKQGETSDEILISCHVCHPSLADDNLSGIAVATFLASSLLSKHTRYSYRFLFVPGTIGAIAWLSQNRESAFRIKHGLVLSCLGDAHGFNYKKSRRGDAEIDRAVEHLLRNGESPYEVTGFSPYGYDERQYCSPGFNLPVGSLRRGVHGRFSEYHTSADNLDFIKPAKLAEALEFCEATLDLLEKNRTYTSLNPFCEPQLGKRGLYHSTGGPDIAQVNLAKLWVLNLADGANSLLDIAERSDFPFSIIERAAAELRDHHLLEEHAAE